ncbi:MAG: hypothetical protein LBI84_09940 [Propionibacteriaceae bacterium]|nr:hypothetical protein [Propionibacteriaceae bacterium]
MADLEVAAKSAASAAAVPPFPHSVIIQPFVRAEFRCVAFSRTQSNKAIIEVFRQDARTPTALYALHSGLASWPDLEYSCSGNDVLSSAQLLQIASLTKAADAMFPSGADLEFVCADPIIAVQARPITAMPSFPVVAPTGDT